MSRVRDGLLLAVSYYVTAKLGLQLAIPPGYATAVWPAAGIALAGVLLRPSAWPGVVLGSFLANLPTAITGDVGSSIRSGLLALSIALGATGQAVLAALLVRRFVGFPNPLATPLAVTRFYLLGGPLACLLSSTWGVTSLVVGGVAPLREAAFNWWTWWVGDTIGSLTAAPMILVWAARRKDGSLRRPLAVCVPLCLIFAAIVVLFFYTSTWENDRLRSEFERRADNLAHRVTGHVDVYLEVLRSIVSLYSSTSVMNGQVFRDFVEHPLARHSGIQALSWNVRVSQSRRHLFEEALRREGYRDFEITERAGNGAILRAGQRSEYVVVTYIEPRAANASAVGFDVASEPERLATLEQAQASGSPAATPRIRLVQEAGDQFGFLVFVPAFKPDSAEAGNAARRPVEAYAVGVFHIADMLSTLLGGEDREGIGIQLRDETAPESEKILFEPGSSAPLAGKSPGFERTVRFPMAGREWALVFRLLPDYLATHRPWQAWSVLAAGLLFGGLLGAFLLVVTGRTIEIERLVQDRTGELQRANAQLNAEALERERTERELERVMSSVSDCLWGARVDPGNAFHYVYCSPTIERIAGRSPQFFTEGRHRWLSAVHEEDRPRVEAVVERLVSGESETQEAEYRVVLPDGTSRWVRESVTTSRTPEGALHLSGVISDITAPKETERLTRERETQEAEAKRDERFRSLIENASDVILVLDRGARVLYVSPSGESLLGHPAADLTGRDVLDLVAADDRGELAGQLTELSTHPGATTELRARVRDEGGSWRLMEGTARNLLGKPEVGGIVVNCREVTERARLEDQLRQSQKMEAVGRLAGGIAHDFNNLLGVITGHSELLAKEVEAQEPALQRVEQIRKAADRASGLTRQLLAFSRKQLQRLEVLDLNVIAGDIGKMLRRVIGEDIQLVTALGSQLGRVRADPGQVEQILLNLAVNARDAMPQGGKLTIETANVDLDQAFAETHAGVTPRAHVMLAVTDTGHGMDEATLAHIFEPFFTTKGEGKGTGLGLATVYGIVKQSGGYVDVSSAVGLGATFRVYLPRLDDREPVTTPSAAVSVPAPQRGSETILLVEDDASLRSLIHEVLSEAGYRVLEAASAEQAVEIARSHPDSLDLLLTDVIMPGMSGRQVAEAVSSTRPGTKVLYMSGYTHEALGPHQVLESGTHLLEKPFSSDVVLRKVRELLDHR